MLLKYITVLDFQKSRTHNRNWPPCCIVDGRTFSPADRDTKKANGITHRQIVKYDRTYNKKAVSNTVYLTQHSLASIKCTLSITGFHSPQKRRSTLLQSTGRPCSGLSPPVLTKQEQRTGQLRVDSSIIMTKILLRNNE